MTSEADITDDIENALTAWANSYTDSGGIDWPLLAAKVYEDAVAGLVAERDELRAAVEKIKEAVRRTEEYVVGAEVPIIGWQYGWSMHDAVYAALASLSPTPLTEQEA